MEERQVRTPIYETFMAGFKPETIFGNINYGKTFMKLLKNEIEL